MKLVVMNAIIIGSGILGYELDTYTNAQGPVFWIIGLVAGFAVGLMFSRKG